MKRLWVTGYRNYELNVFGQKDPKIAVIKYALSNTLTNLLEDAELDWLITGPNLGVEQYAIEVGLELRKKYPLKVSMMTPYQNFAHRWNEDNQNKFLALKDQVDFYASTSNSDYHSPVQLRNYQNFMLLHTDSALMIYDPEFPGKPKFDYELINKYQQNHDYELNLIDFFQLQDLAQKYEESQRKDPFEY